MYAENLNAQLLAALDRPDLRVVAAALRISFDASLQAPFRADPGGEVVLGADCMESARICAFHIRHALELSMLLDGVRRLEPAGGLMASDLLVLAGLSAARTAALFWQLDGPSDPEAAAGEPVSWLGVMSETRMPQAAILDLVWTRVRILQGPCYQQLRHACPDPEPVPEAVTRRLEEIWHVLGPAETLMAGGGDHRLAVDPRTGLNHYGCSHRPRPWAITFASSTASSLSERGFGGAEAARRRLAAAALAGQAALAACRESQAVRQGIAAFYDLPTGCDVALAASGTDCELLVLALAGSRGPVSSILTAPEETGTGVPLAAAGRHFADDTSGRQRVSKGATIEGFRHDTRVLPLAARRADGSPRPGAEIEAECCALVATQREAGRHVLLHLLDLSKTGLLAPSIDCLQRLQARHGKALEVVVDACQARLDPKHVRGYLARGWMVMITGSKFFTGPPFCGAVLLPGEAAARLAGAALPAGLSAYGSRSDWPDGAAAASHLPRPVNLGMVLRWQAALAEMRAFGAVPQAQIRSRLLFFLSGVRKAIAAQPCLRLIDVSAPDRASILPAGSQMTASWDQLQTILSFLVLENRPGADAPTPLPLARARLLYRWLNADVAAALPAACCDQDRRLGGLLCHIGQPVPVPHAALGGQPAGALRISAGARLISGEPSHEGLDADRRLAREIADAGRVLDKIRLLLRHWDALQAADPEPSYAPRPPTSSGA